MRRSHCQRASQQPNLAILKSRTRVDASSSGGTPVTEEGGNNITAELIATMQQQICEALETDRVTVQDIYGDGRHVSIDVVSSAFEGKNLVARQRMVYKAIWLQLQDVVHAVDAMSTKTPAEADG